MARKTKAQLAAEAAAREAAAAPLPYDIAMPHRALVPAGAVFAAGNYVRIKGVVPRELRAARLQGGSIGTHGEAADGTTSLCKCSLISPTKNALPNIASRDGEVLYGEAAAAAVTCRFCAARLIACGMLTAETLNASMSADARAYALDYGTRHYADEAAAVEARAREAADAVKAAAVKAEEAAAKAARKAARDAKQTAKALPLSPRTAKAKASRTAA